MSVRNGSQLTGLPWNLRLAGHTSATHTFLVYFDFLCPGDGDGDDEDSASVQEDERKSSLSRGDKSHLIVWEVAVAT